MPLRRSDINRSIRNARHVFDHFGIALPAWASRRPGQWDAVVGELLATRIGLSQYTHEKERTRLKRVRLKP